MKRFVFASVALVLAALASAQTSSTATGSAGSVAGAPTGSSNYTGLSGSASSATIGYANPAGGTGTEDKFAGSGSELSGKTFAGSGYGNGSTNYGSQGSSKVTNAGFGFPTYYTATFSQQVADSSTAPVGAGGGTFDPYPVHRGDLSTFGSSADLYFQAGLRQTGTFNGSTVATGFSDPYRVGASYEFDAYITNASNVRQDLFSFLVTATTGVTGAPSVSISTSYSAPSGFRTVLLDPTSADGSDTTPTQRLNSRRSMTFGSSAELSALLAFYIGSDGSLSRDLEFGILRQGFAVPTSGNSTDTLFSWHADVLNRIGSAQPTPEPATFAALGLGVAAFLRRRKRS